MKKEEERSKIFYLHETFEEKFYKSLNILCEEINEPPRLKSRGIL